MKATFERAVPKRRPRVVVGSPRLSTFSLYSSLRMPSLSANDEAHTFSLRRTLIRAALASGSVKVRAYVLPEELADVLRVYVECKEQPIFATVLVTRERAARDGLVPGPELWLYPGGFWVPDRGAVAHAIMSWAREHFSANLSPESVLVTVV